MNEGHVKLYVFQIKSGFFSSMFDISDANVNLSRPAEPIILPTSLYHFFFYDTSSTTVP